MQLRIALVHDWLYAYAGAERVLEQIVACYPEVVLYSLIDFVPDSQRAFLHGKQVRTSFLQSAPFARRLYQKYLPLMPAAIESLDLREYDLVVSTSSAVAKGVLTTPAQLHICYLQARNLRYLYDERFAYRPASWLAPLQEVVLSQVRVWDSVAAQRPDVTLANSQFVRRWHRHRHGIDATVVYPPVDTKRLSSGSVVSKADYFVTVGRFERYKQFALAIEAFNRLGRRLIVIGDGSQYKELRRLAKRNIEFTGLLPPDQVVSIVGAAAALVYCAREDFGIAPVEAQAAGTPVIAFAEGGAAETVRGLGEDRPTGVLFEEQSVVSVVEAVKTFEGLRSRFEATACRENAEGFGIDRFRVEFMSEIERQWGRFTGEVTQDGSL